VPSKKILAPIIGSLVFESYIVPLIDKAGKQKPISNTNKIIFLVNL
tara:strand:- start:371 stop:508 length:138 start_codon:yes stop_codon:yes gene_type:complete